MGSRGTDLFSSTGQLDRLAEGGNLRLIVILFFKTNAATMKKILTFLLTLAFLTGSSSCQKEIIYENGITNLGGEYFGQKAPATKPERFGPRIIEGTSDRNWHGKLGFSPDGTRFFMEVYCSDSVYSMQILEMAMKKEFWMIPNSPNFTIGSNTTSPVYLNDGNSVLFLSYRPGGGPFGLNRSELVDNEWTDPVPFVVPMKAGLSGGWECSVARNGNIYMRMEEKNSPNGPDLFVIRNVDGEYLPPENLGLNVNSPEGENGPFIDPDEEYLIFASKRDGGKGSFDLYVSFRSPDGGWEPAKSLGSGINTLREETCPYVSPDKKYLFFNRYKNGIRNPYWVDASVIYN